MKTTTRHATALSVALASALLLAGADVSAQNAVRGKQLYETRLNPAYFSCSDGTFCHGPNPSAGQRNIRRGTTATNILNAINSVQQMTQLRGFVSSTDAADLAAYIANPAAATAPLISASATSLAFGATQVAATNTMPVPAGVMLTNTGAGNLTITGINKTGTNAADFAATGTCASASTVTLPPGASCTLSASFTPSAAGTRTATLTVASNAATNPAIALSGTGSSVPVPAATLSRASVAFPTQTVGTSSTAQQVTLTNSGTGGLTITQVAATPSPEFTATGNCVGTVNPGASCTISVTFAPTAAGSRSGTLTITSNASGSPNAIALAGLSVLTPTPIVTTQSNVMAFPMTTVGVMSTGLSTTLTNTGNAPLQITGVTLGGANASEFQLAAGNTCAAGTLAVGASCRLEVAFQPQSTGTKTAAVAVAHNAEGGATTVNVTGTAGTAQPPPVYSGIPSSALAPSNVGGAGALAPAQWLGLALTLLLVPPLRRRLART